MKPPTGPNYEEWTLAAMAYLSSLGYWGIITGTEHPPLKPFVPVATGSSSGSTKPASEGATGSTAQQVATAAKDQDPYSPESNDPAYLAQFYRYYERYQLYITNLVKASGAIRSAWCSATEEVRGRGIHHGPQGALGCYQGRETEGVQAGWTTPHVKVKYH